MTAKVRVGLILCAVGASAVLLLLLRTGETKAPLAPQTNLEDSAGAVPAAGDLEAADAPAGPIPAPTHRNALLRAVPTPVQPPAPPQPPVVSAEARTATNAKRDAREPSPLVQAVTDPDHPQRKWLAAHELPGKHSAADIAVMAAYLTDHPIGAAEYLGEEFAHRNYIMDVLREQQEQWLLVTDAFVKMYSTPEQGDVMRGYALQHLCSLYIDNPEALPQADRKRIITTFRRALPEREEGTLAATALIGLHEVSRVDPKAIPAKELDSLALDLLRDPASGDLSRISALHIAGERRLTEAVPVARRYAADPGADWVVRMAAIWLLGQFDGETDLLEQMARDPDENIRHAALAALAREK